MSRARGRKMIFLFSLLLLLFPSAAAFAQTLSAEEVVGQAHRVLFYSGNDMKAKVQMRLVSKEGRERVRELTMLRKNLQQGGEQRFFIYFYSPADVRDMTFMIWKHPQRDDERWLFLPALKLVRRIAANDKRSSFVGSDFSYEDVSGREVEEDTHALLREETLAGRPVFVMRSVPKDAKSADFSYRLAWVDKENFVLWREEYYDKRNELYKLFTADEVKQVQGLWTAVRRTMKNVQNGHRTEVTFLDVRYNVGLEDSLFTERYLQNPPARWIR
ncbi:MAG TPA: outer membrane lipoprotein-sorting protein [Candidatus Acidoferrales bacterium]